MCFWCHLFLWDNGWLFRCHSHCCWWQETTIFPNHLFSLPFPSDSPLISNPVNFRNRKTDGLPAQVCWHMNWHVRSWAFLSQDASICIYICMYVYMYIYLCVYVCLKHCKKWCYAVPALLWGCTNYSSVWDMPRRLADHLEIPCQVSKVWSFVSLDKWSQLLLNLEDSPSCLSASPMGLASQKHLSKSWGWSLPPPLPTSLPFPPWSSCLQGQCSRMDWSSFFLVQLKAFAPCHRAEEIFKDPLN